MSERIDILTNEIGSLPFFSVDNTHLTMSVFTGLSNYVLRNAEGYTKFEKGDNFVIGSFGLVMPLSFQIDRSIETWEACLRFKLYAIGVTTGKYYVLREISMEALGIPSIYGVMENYDLPADIFIDILRESPMTGSYLKDEPFMLWMELAYPSMQISMAGVPDALNGTEQYMIPYIKVYHNKPLT